MLAQAGDVLGGRRKRRGKALSVSPIPRVDQVKHHMLNRVPIIHELAFLCDDIKRVLKSAMASYCLSSTTFGNRVGPMV